MKSTPARRSRRLLAAIALGGLAVTGCTDTTPSNKRVALDIIATMGADRQGSLTPDEQQCMIDEIEDNYTDQELNAIADAGENINAIADSELADFPENGTDELQAFVADLTSCTTGETAPATSNGEPSDTTETSGTGEGTATTAVGTSTPGGAAPTTTGG